MSLPYNGTEQKEDFDDYLNRLKNNRKGEALTAKVGNTNSANKFTIKSQGSLGTNGMNLLTTIKTPSTSKAPEVWVKKWVDYSTKYGLGYMLSNNA